MTKAEIMRLAHKLAKAMVSDYQARMVLALRRAWTLAKEAKEVKLNVRVIDSPRHSKIVGSPFAAITCNGVKVENPRGLWGKSGGVIEIQAGEVWEIEMGATFRVGSRTERSREKVVIAPGVHQLVHDQSQCFKVQVTVD